MAEAYANKQFRKRGFVYACTICQHYSDLRQMVDHYVKRHIADEDVPFRCEACGGRFSKETSFRQHARVRHPRLKADDIAGGTRKEYHLLPEYAIPLPRDETLVFYSRRYRLPSLPLDSESLTESTAQLVDEKDDQQGVQVVVEVTSELSRPIDGVDQVAVDKTKSCTEMSAVDESQKPPKIPVLKRKKVSTINWQGFKIPRLASPEEDQLSLGLKSPMMNTLLHHDTLDVAPDDASDVAPNVAPDDVSDDASADASGEELHDAVSVSGSVSCASSSYSSSSSSSSRSLSSPPAPSRILSNEEMHALGVVPLSAVENLVERSVRTSVDSIASAILTASRNQPTPVTAQFGSVLSQLMEMNANMGNLSTQFGRIASIMEHNNTKQLDLACDQLSKAVIDINRHLLKTADATRELVSATNNILPSVFSQMTILRSFFKGVTDSNQALCTQMQNQHTALMSLIRRLNGLVEDERCGGQVPGMVKRILQLDTTTDSAQLGGSMVADSEAQSAVRGVSNVSDVAPKKREVPAVISVPVVSSEINRVKAAIISPDRGLTEQMKRIRALNRKRTFKQ